MTNMSDERIRAEVLARVGSVPRVLHTLVNSVVNATQRPTSDVMRVICAMDRAGDVALSADANERRYIRR